MNTRIAIILITFSKPKYSAMLTLAEADARRLATASLMPTAGVAIALSSHQCICRNLE
ncbi:MAG: hypothetical protein V7K92_15170 [Nostoc sp.]|uniref:hypothetical protein n=1 Tax=Nostoc sp. TaxID=1180 RepID=UPI002FF18DB8